MNVTNALFYVFSAVLLLAAFRVITAKNPVQAVLFLVLTFFQAAMIWMLLRAEFLSIILVLVYVGAVMVLFMFVVMMMDMNIESIRFGFWRHFPFAALVGVIIALEMAAVLMGAFRWSSPINPTAVNPAISENNTRDIGVLMFTQYIYQLEVAAAILLVAIIAAIALTLRERKDSKHASPSEQVRVKSRDRLFVIKMDATKASPDSLLKVNSEVKK